MKPFPVIAGKTYPGRFTCYSGGGICLNRYEICVLAVYRGVLAPYRIK